MGTGSLRRHHDARRVAGLENRLRALRADIERKTNRADALVREIADLQDRAEDMAAVLEDARAEAEEARPVIEAVEEPIEEEAAPLDEDAAEENDGDDEDGDPA